MMIGQVLFAATDAGLGTDTVYYSPWFPSQGNAATFACEVIAKMNMDVFEIDVQTKNSEQSDKSQDVFEPANGSGNSIALTANTTTKFTVGAALNATATNGLLELVRFRYRIMANEGFGGEAAVHFRVLDPAWLTN